MRELVAPFQPRSYAYDNNAKLTHSRAVRAFYRAAQRELRGDGFTFKTYFNPGGIAVWGETYLKVYRDGKPIVEAYDTNMGMLVRQWDGHYSGHNHYVSNLFPFVFMVRELAAKPFVRF